MVEALAEHDAAVHSSGCGMHPSMIDKVSLAIEEEACPGCATIAQYQRLIADRDEQHRQANPKAGPGSPLPSDGLHVHLRMLTPEEAAARAAKAGPTSKGAADG